MPLLPVDRFIQQQKQRPYHVDKDNTCGTTVIYAQVLDVADSAAGAAKVVNREAIPEHAIQGLFDSLNRRHPLQIPLVLHLSHLCKLESLDSAIIVLHLDGLFINKLPGNPCINPADCAHCCSLMILAAMLCCDAAPSLWSRLSLPFCSLLARLVAKLIACLNVLHC